MSICLEIRNLSVRRGAEKALEDISLSIPAYQLTGLTGPNGGGKTSLFEAIAGLCPIEGGSISFAKSEDFSYLPQQLLPKKILPLTVLDFVKMGTWGPARKSLPALSVQGAIEVLQLKSFARNLLSELSGGQWRRALLARCLVQAADLYLLDEPFNQLDIEMESTLGELLKKLSRENQKTFFIISHDWHAMDHYFDSLYLLNRKVITKGPVREVNDFYMNWKNPEHHRKIHHS